MIYWQKLALLLKTEAAYGVAETLAAPNAIIASDVSYTPMDGSEETRELLMPYLGHQGVELDGDVGRLEFSVDVVGAGSAGNVPHYGPLLRASGFAETVTASTRVDYTLIDSGYESATIHYIRDRRRYALIGCRGTMRFEATARRIPRMRFTILGLHGAVPSDVARPTVSPVNFIKGRKAAKGYTTMTLHGHAGPGASLSIDIGNELNANLKINEDAIEIVDRRVTGTAVFDAVSFATKNWEAAAKANTLDALAFQHGTAAGQIFELGGPKIQIGRYTEGQSSKIVQNTLPLFALPDAGNDEIKITVR